MSAGKQRKFLIVHSDPAFAEDARSFVGLECDARPLVSSNTLEAQRMMANHPQLRVILVQAGIRGDLDVIHHAKFHPSAPGVAVIGKTPDDPKCALPMAHGAFGPLFTKGVPNGKMCAAYRERMINIIAATYTSNVERGLVAREFNELLDLYSPNTKDRILDLLVPAVQQDFDRQSHVQSVGRGTKALLTVAGYDSRTAIIGKAAGALHDLGKARIDPCIITKPGPLTPRQRSDMQKHPSLGKQVIQALYSVIPDAEELLDAASESAGHHHERWDGDGYVDGRKGNANSPVAQAAVVADVTDALKRQRPYKMPKPASEVREVVYRDRGKHFSPKFADAYLDAFPEMQETFIPSTQAEKVCHATLA